MVARLGRSVPEMSLILAEVNDHVVSTQGHLLQDLNQPWLQPNQPGGGCPGNPPERRSPRQLLGLCRGTIRPICRPGENLRVVYNGHKRVHCLKFQSVVPPNGMIANFFGPIGESIGLIS